MKCITLNVLLHAAALALASPVLAPEKTAMTDRKLVPTVLKNSKTLSGDPPMGLANSESAPTIDVPEKMNKKAVVVDDKKMKTGEAPTKDAVSDNKISNAIVNNTKTKTTGEAPTKDAVSDNKISNSIVNNTKTKKTGELPTKDAVSDNKNTNAIANEKENKTTGEAPTKDMANDNKLTNAIVNNTKTKTTGEAPTKDAANDNKLTNAIVNEKETKKTGEAPTKDEVSDNKITNAIVIEKETKKTGVLNNNNNNTHSLTMRTIEKGKTPTADVVKKDEKTANTFTKNAEAMPGETQTNKQRFIKTLSKNKTVGEGGGDVAFLELPSVGGGRVEGVLQLLEGDEALFERQSKAWLQSMAEVDFETSQPAWAPTKTASIDLHICAAIPEMNEEIDKAAAVHCSEEEKGLPCMLKHLKQQQVGVQKPDFDKHYLYRQLIGVLMLGIADKMPDRTMAELDAWDLMTGGSGTWRGFMTSSSGGVTEGLGIAKNVVGCVVEGATFGIASAKSAEELGLLQKAADKERNLEALPGDELAADGDLATASPQIQSRLQQLEQTLSSSMERLSSSKLPSMERVFDTAEDTAGKELELSSPRPLETLQQPSLERGFSSCIGVLTDVVFAVVRYNEMTKDDLWRVDGVVRTQLAALKELKAIRDLPLFKGEDDVGMRLDGLDGASKSTAAALRQIYCLLGLLRTFKVARGGKVIKHNGIEYTRTLEFTNVVDSSAMGGSSAVYTDKMLTALGEKLISELRQYMELLTQALQRDVMRLQLRGLKRADEMHNFARAAEFVKALTTMSQEETQVLVLQKAMQKTPSSEGGDYAKLMAQTEEAQKKLVQSYATKMANSVTALQLKGMKAVVDVGQELAESVTAGRLSVLMEAEGGVRDLKTVQQKSLLLGAVTRTLKNKVAEQTERDADDWDKDGISTLAKCSYFHARLEKILDAKCGRKEGTEMECKARAKDLDQWTEDAKVYDTAFSTFRDDVSDPSEGTSSFKELKSAAGPFSLREYREKGGFAESWGWKNQIDADAVMKTWDMIWKHTKFCTWASRRVSASGQGMSSAGGTVIQSTALIDDPSNTEPKRVPIQANELVCDKQPIKPVCNPKRAKNRASGLYCFYSPNPDLFLPRFKPETKQQFQDMGCKRKA
jgi:hypothetical protein